MSETHGARADRRATGRARAGDTDARQATPSSQGRHASITAAALRASEEQYRRFVEDDIAGVFITTPPGAILLCNPAFVTMFGFGSVEAALAVDMVSLYEAPGDRADVLAALRAEGRVDRREMRLHHRDGSTVHAVLTAIGEFDEEGELTQIRGYLLDITERRRLEEQLRQAQKMEAIGRLAGGIAHDFNNLLTAINGYATMLAESLADDDPRRADTDEIRRAGDRAAQLTRQLLAFSRRQVLQPAVLDVNTVVAGLAPMLGRLIGEHIELRIVPADDLGHVQADPAQLEQVILNLALNARDAMPDGGTLTIETTNADVSADYVISHPGVTPGLYVCLVVSDTGVGMAPATRAHLFEPFFTTKAPGEGTGLGLATVYGITSQSGGHVTVYSELGYGASFKVYLPRVAAPLPSGLQPAVARPVGGSETVLLVEDEESVRSFATRVLTGLNYRLLIASNASNALDVAGAHRGRIDLLLTDVMLPGMNGRRLSEALTALRPGLRTLFVSGYTEDTVVQQGILRRGADFLGKPFTPDALAAAVRSALTRKLGPIGVASPFMPPFATQYLGPTKGPTARRLSSPIAYVASDMGNGGVAAVCAAVREAAQSMGWTLQAFDGHGHVADRAAALRQALALGSAGIILGGFDPTEQPDHVAAAVARGIPVVGWHAGTRPGPAPSVGMFTNVSTHPLDVATLAAYYAIADSNGGAGVVIYTDSQYQIALDKAEQIRAIIEQHRGCSVLDFVDTPIATAAARVPPLVAAQLRTFGPAFTHLLAVNGNYVTGSRVALQEAGLRGTDAPHAIAAGDGDEAEFGRIREHDFQAASVAEPLFLQGWQLVDELNRALAGEDVSGVPAPPSLITPSNVPAGNVFDPASGYRDHYRRIWHPLVV